MASPAAAAPTRRRLHPLTPLLRGARALAAVIAMISWQGYVQLGPGRWLLAVVAILVVVLLASLLSWVVTGFTVTGRELRIVEGLLWRRTRVIPLERVQAVDLVEPVLARVFGLAELRLEVVGGRRTEGSLAFLTVPEAEALRHGLLAMTAAPAPPATDHAPAPPTTGAVPAASAAGSAATPPATGDPATSPATADGADPPAAAGAGSTAARAGRPGVLHTVDNRHVLIGHLLTVPTLLLPLALIATALPLVAASDWSFVGAASAITALVGTVAAPVRRMLGEWHFTIVLEPSGLRLRRGLAETRAQSVPPRRVQAVAIVRPLLWRRFGWYRSRVDIAGYGTAEAGVRGGTLLPVADRATTVDIVGRVLAGVYGAGWAPGDVLALRLPRPPRRARWLAPMAWPITGFAVTDRLVFARSGRLTRQLLVAPLARVQSVRVVQGPVQRALRLATVHVDTAGSGLAVVGRYLDAAAAYATADEIAARALAARRHS